MGMYDYAVAIQPILINQRVESVQNEQRSFQDCSLLLFLALAFADDVFEDTTPEQLLSLEPLHRDSHRTVPFRTDKLRDFVLKSGPKSNALSDDTFRRDMKGLMTRAGYVNVDQMQLYSIRRGIANVVKS